MTRVLYSCANCGRSIFAEEHIIKKVNLWDLKEYQAEAYMLRDVLEMGTLRRYDCSLHEGWYCCRFIMMRMLQDKFGTGDALLVYTDSVVPHLEGEMPAIKSSHKGQIKLSARDFDDVMGANDGKLKVVKLGGIWCPPCRLMDTLIAAIDQERTLPEVSFFEVDIDQEQSLASRFENLSIPYLLFYLGGKRLVLSSDKHVIVDGGVIGGLTRHELETICRKILEEAARGKINIHIE